MIPTGKYHPTLGHELMQLEEHDINWTERPWEGLSFDEQADFLNFAGIGFMCAEIKDEVVRLYQYYQKKNLGEDFND